jgi:hypothetical protein
LIRTDRKPAIAPLMITTFILELVLAFRDRRHDRSPRRRSGHTNQWADFGLFIWAGIIFTTMTINNRYQGFGWDLTLIDGLHWLLVMVGIGLTIGWFGV